MWSNPIARFAGALGGAFLVAAAVAGIAAATGGGLHLGGSNEDAISTPKSRVAALNPDDHCVMLPSTSDIVEHPEKHTKWHILAGECPTPTATGTGTATATGGPHTAATPTGTSTVGEDADEDDHDGVEPTEAAEPTEVAEPTETPEPTEAAEPTEVHEPDGAHNVTPNPHSVGHGGSD